MRRQIYMFSILVSVSLILLSCTQNTKMTQPKHPYLGQIIPGTIPEIFAPGLISTDDHLEFGCAWSPDGREFYFTRRGGEYSYNTLMVCRWNDTLWTEPEVVVLSDRYPKMTPRFFPDGSKMVYTGWRPPQQNANTQSPFNLYIVNRSDGLWNEAEYFKSWFSMSISQNGTIYCHSNDGIGISIAEDGQYGDPKILGDEINAGHFDQHPFVSFDEKYFLFDSHRPEGFGDADIFVAFREGKDNWQTVLNLGDRINNHEPNFCPAISPDGKYLFYTTGEDIYWVDAKIIEDLKPDHLK